MASSLEVVRHRITSAGMSSPGQYPLPPSAHKRMSPTGITGAPQFSSHSRLVPLGFVGRHSWSAVSSQANSVLANRVQRLNFRFSPPTLGEEELCRSWIQNSAKLSKRNNDEKMASPATKHNVKSLERPKTAQSYGHQFRDLMGRRAGAHQSAGRLTSPGREHNTSSDSERIASPPISRGSSPNIGSRKMNKIPEESHSSSPAFIREQPSRNLPHTDKNLDRFPLRPHSARPQETRRRTRARAANTPPKLRTGSAGNPWIASDKRRWSFSESVTNHYDIKDDDSAYSSSRDITALTDRAQTSSPSPPKSPPRSAPNSRPTEDRALRSGKLSRARVQKSTVMISGQDGRPVFYYQQNDPLATGDSQIMRNSADDRTCVPLRRPGRLLQRPVTQPTMGTRHARNSISRKPIESNSLREDMEEKLMARALPRGSPYSTESKQRPSSSNIATRQRTLLMREQRTIKSISQYVEPELLKRILDWLAKVETNPKFYYGFETDLFGDSIRTSEST